MNTIKTTTPEEQEWAHEHVRWPRTQARLWRLRSEAYAATNATYHETRAEELAAQLEVA